MTPPTWLDARGRRPTLACWTFGRELATSASARRTSAHTRAIATDAGDPHLVRGLYRVPARDGWCRPIQIWDHHRSERGWPAALHRRDGRWSRATAIMGCGGDTNRSNRWGSPLGGKGPWYGGLR
jgi:hypothetical protein